MAQGTTEHIELTAPDISCGHCVATVQNALSGQEGVASVSASEVSKIVSIDYDPSVITVETISSVLAEEGYPVQV